MAQAGDFPIELKSRLSHGEFMAAVRSVGCTGTNHQTLMRFAEVVKRSTGAMNRLGPQVRRERSRLFVKARTPYAETGSANVLPIAWPQTSQIRRKAFVTARRLTGSKRSGVAESALSSLTRLTALARHTGRAMPVSGSRPTTTRATPSGSSLTPSRRAESSSRTSC